MSSSISNGTFDWHYGVCWKMHTLQSRSDKGPTGMTRWLNEIPISLDYGYGSAWGSNIKEIFFCLRACAQISYYLNEEGGLGSISKLF